MTIIANYRFVLLQVSNCKRNSSVITPTTNSIQHTCTDISKHSTAQLTYRPYRSKNYMSVCSQKQIYCRSRVDSHKLTLL